MSITKQEVVEKILGERFRQPAKQTSATAFAPSNIALCKYWGKRDIELNLPVTSSLSISLGDKGAETTLKLSDASSDSLFLNGQQLEVQTRFGLRVVQFLDLFRPVNQTFEIHIKMNIPLAAGLASSACGFASLVLALNKLFNWDLPLKELSIFSRMGSGSASRSLWSGFVEWHAGTEADGMDSFSEPLNVNWADMQIGLVILSEAAKPISSREAMQRTVKTSKLYAAWPEQVKIDLARIKQAIYDNDFDSLGSAAEGNALAMHATMLASWPPVCYYLPSSISAMQKVWDLRAQGVSVYFTQDAGPNIKLLFLEKDAAIIKSHFPQLERIHCRESLSLAI